MKKVKLLIVTIFLFNGFFACAPTYESVRVHIPQQTKKNQAQVEATLPELDGNSFGTQIDGSYTITDNIVISAGGIFHTYDDHARGADGASTDETFMGVHAGAGYLHKYNDWLRFTSLLGMSAQSWTYNTTPNNDELFDDVGFDRFDATVLSPFGQAGLILGKEDTNITFLVRVETPMFNFSNTKPKERTVVEFDDEGNTSERLVTYNLDESLVLLIPTIQANLGVSDHFSLFAQTLTNRTFGLDENSGIDVRIFGLYLGGVAKF